MYRLPKRYKIGLQLSSGARAAQFYNLEGGSLQDDETVEEASKR